MNKNIKKAMKQSTLMNILNIGSIVLILVAAISFICVVMIGKKVDTANSNRFDLTYNANRFMNGSAYLTSEVRAYSATKDEVHFDNYWNEINNLKNRDIGVANMKKIGITSAEQGKIDEMSALSNELVPLESAAMDQVKSGNQDVAIQAVFGDKYESTIQKISSTKAAFLQMLDDRAKKQVDTLESKSLVLEIVTGIFIAFVAFLQIISVIVIRKKIVFPIIAIQKEMLEFSKGNLHSQFNLEEDTSEIGTLVGSIILTKTELSKYINDIDRVVDGIANGNFNIGVSQPFIGDFVAIEKALTHICDSLSGTMGEINIAAEQVSSGSEQVSSGAQALAQGTTEQASSIQELSASIEEISEQIKQNATNAMNSNTKIGIVGSEINQSNEKMQSMILAMKDINTKSNEIGNIIKAIDDIAFQTNILALNAAVEAARAGSAGKGFAVVAGEVKNLANKSAAAAKDITKLIEDSIKSIDNGTSIADETAKSLRLVVTSTMETVELIKNISKASNEQANSISQINQGVEQISEIIQTNSATAEESSAASEELSAQAESLKQLVAKFNLKNSSSFNGNDGSNFY